MVVRKQGRYAVLCRGGSSDISYRRSKILRAYRSADNSVRIQVLQTKIAAKNRREFRSKAHARPPGPRKSICRQGVCGRRRTAGNATIAIWRGKLISEDTTG